MASVVRAAPAKLNLYLHVVGRRPNGYHELESLVAFADVGDMLSAQSAGGLSLSLAGPFASALGDTPAADNLVLRAARALRMRKPGAGAALLLEKRLPVASGIGGGSADAAAALHALNDLWQLDLSDAALSDVGLALGADVPVCIHGTPAFVGGAGELVTAVPPLPPLHLVLANPGVALPTPAVYRAYAAQNPKPSRLRAAPKGPWENADCFVRDMAAAANDLESAAIALCPPIAEVLNALAQHGRAVLVRMSGSGATCFGLYTRHEDAQTAAQAIARAMPHWWVASAAWKGPAKR